MAHTQASTVGKACHCRQLRAKMKYLKQERLIWEVIIPTDQHEFLSIKEIKDQCIIFDGSSNGPLPPTTTWWCLLALHLYWEQQDLYSWWNWSSSWTDIFFTHWQFTSIYLPFTCNGPCYDRGLLPQKRIDALDACMKSKKAIRGVKNIIFSDCG